MKVMVIVKATVDSEAGIMPKTEMFEAMGKYNEELVKAGIMLSGDGLRPSSDGKRVHFSGTRRIVTDGPFAETKEYIGGFTIGNAADLDEALEWGRKAVVACRAPVEVRQFGIPTSERAQRRLKTLKEKS